MRRWPATTSTHSNWTKYVCSTRWITNLTASQRERYAYYGRAARTSLELSDKVHD